MHLLRRLLPRPDLQTGRCLSPGLRGRRMRDLLLSQLCTPYLLPMRPESGCALVAASQAIRPAVGPGRGLSGPIKSKTTAAPTTGTIAEANSRPLLLSTPLTTPSAAANPKTLLPHRTTAWHSSPDPVGPNAAALRVPGAPPRTAIAPSDPLVGGSP